MFDILDSSCFRNRRYMKLSLLHIRLWYDTWLLTTMLVNFYKKLCKWKKCWLLGGGFEGVGAYQGVVARRARNIRALRLILRMELQWVNSNLSEPKAKTNGKVKNINNLWASIPKYDTNCVTKIRIKCEKSAKWKILFIIGFHLAGSLIKNALDYDCGTISATWVFFRGGVTGLNWGGYFSSLVSKLDTETLKD